MSVRHNARLRMFREVSLEPFFLLGACPTSPDSWSIAIGIERHHMPFSQVVAVISLAPRPRSFAPIREISQPPWRIVFMISRRRPRPVLEFPPRPVVARAEFFHRPAVVGQISRREHRPRNLLDQLCGCCCSLLSSPV